MPTGDWATYDAPAIDVNIIYEFIIDNKASSHRRHYIRRARRSRARSYSAGSLSIMAAQYRREFRSRRTRAHRKWREIERGRSSVSRLMEERRRDEGSRRPRKRRRSPRQACLSLMSVTSLSTTRLAPSTGFAGWLFYCQRPPIMARPRSGAASLLPAIIGLTYALGAAASSALERSAGGS